jgi:hypothetical protein
VCFNDKTCPLKFLGKLKSLGVVCSKCISVAKSSAPPPASACNCIKRSPSPVCKPGQRALDMMKQRQGSAEDSAVLAGAIAAPRNTSQVAKASSHGIQTQPLRRSLRHPSNPSTTLQLEPPQVQHNIPHPSRPRSTPPPRSTRTTTPRPTSQPRAQSPPAAPCHKHREQSGRFTSTRPKPPSRLVPSPPCAPNPRTRRTRPTSPASSARARVSAASGVTAPSTLRQLRLSQSIAQNLPSDPPAPRRMSPRRSASGGGSGVGFHCRVSPPGNVVPTVVNDILDLEVRQEKGYPPRRCYRVSWFPCGSRPDSWIDCPPNHLVMMFEKKNPQHVAYIDGEIKRRKGGRPPLPKTSTLAENVCAGRQDSHTVYEPEDPKKKAYTRYRRADICGCSSRIALSHFLRYEVWRTRMGARWFGQCEMCGDRLCCLEPSSWHCAHNVAWTRGGSHDVENRRVSCPKCNMSTSTLNFDEQAELRRPSPATLAAYITAAATSLKWKKIFG